MQPNAETRDVDNAERAAGLSLEEVSLFFSLSVRGVTEIHRENDVTNAPAGCISLRHGKRRFRVARTSSAVFPSGFAPLSVPHHPFVDHRDGRMN